MGDRLIKRTVNSARYIRSIDPMAEDIAQGVEIATAE